VEPRGSGREWIVGASADLCGEPGHHGAQDEIEGQDDEGHADDPRGQRMNARPSETVKKIEEGLVAERVDQDGNGKGDAFRAPDRLADAHVDDHHDEMDRTEKVIQCLQYGLVQTESESDRKIEQGGEAEKGEHGKP